MAKPRNTQRHPHAVHRLSFTSLLIPLLLLAAITTYALFVSSDDNVNAQFAQCFPAEPNSPSAPALTRVPVVGGPTCCLVKVFQAALASRRSTAIMAEILSFVGALLTVTTLESARRGSTATWLVANPTLAFLVFNLAGGAVVWQLVIVPAFLFHARKSETALVMPASTRGQIFWSDVMAVPVAMAVGYTLPCIPFLFAPTETWVFLWLFFPMYISGMRKLVRCFVPQGQTLVHPESNMGAMVVIYAVPVLVSVIAHYALLWELAYVRDDRSAVTRAALGFIQADLGLIAVTAVYWLLVEAGGRVALLYVLVGCIAGPGTGLCVAWVAREGEIRETIGTSVTKGFEAASGATVAKKDK